MTQPGVYFTLDAPFASIIGLYSNVLEGPGVISSQGGHYPTPFLVPTHVQNLPNAGLNVPDPILPSTDPGIARDLVWGMAWRGNVPFIGQAYCVGGKSLYRGGWCPRLLASDLAAWPPTVAQYLTQHYPA